MMRKNLVAALFVAIPVWAYADAASDRTLLFCAQSGTFVESYVEALATGKDKKASTALGFAHLQTVFKEQVDTQMVGLLLSQAGLIDRVPGYRPKTAGAFIAMNCMTNLRERKFLALSKPEVGERLRSLLSSCEAAGEPGPTAACIRKGLPELPYESVD